MISIYGLISDEEPDKIRYIGKAKNINDRLKRHISSYNLKADTHKNKWIKSELSNGNKIQIIIIETIEEDKWQQSEIYWIKKYQEMGHNLTNATPGGDGLLATEEIIKKRNESKIKNNLKLKEKEIDKFKIREVDNKWIGERVCPACNKVVVHSSKDINKILQLIKKSINRSCLSCTRKKNSPFIGHKWSSTKGKKWPNSPNSKTQRDKYGKKILQYINDNLVNEFPSIREASKATKIDRKSISQCIKGIRKSAGGYIFKQKII